MREILFRGEVDSNTEPTMNGKTIEGDYFRMIIGGNERFYIRIYDGKSYRVKRETVRQFTGFLDKNKEKIFEKDIFLDCFREKMIVLFRNGSFIVDFMDDSKSLGKCYLADCHKNIEIIKNCKHDEERD